jgi:Mn2+/Fe2+ NRAMP family transporter
MTGPDTTASREDEGPPGASPSAGAALAGTASGATTIPAAASGAGPLATTGSGATAALRRPSLWRRSLVYLAVLGPGLIAANAGNDAGGIITYASAGAQYKYRTLFFMVLVTVGLVVVQEMCARLGTFTGKGLAALIREEFTLRLAMFALFCLVLANVGLVVSEFAGIGAALELLGVSKYISIPIAAVAIWALVLFGSYRYAERLFLVLTLVFLAYPVAAIMGHPPWTTVGKETLWPHFVGSGQFLLLGVALIGTTITPYMQLYIAAAVADKGMAPEDYKLVRIDSVVGAIFGDLISLLIIVATAAATGSKVEQLSSASQAAQALRPVAGSAANALFGIGLLGASMLAGAVVPLSTAYAMSEAIGVERSVSRRFSEAPFFLSLFTSQVAIGAIVALAPGNLVSLLINMQELNGLITPIILIFILILANRRSVLGDAANGPIFKVVATVVIITVSVLAFIVLLTTVLGWFGAG